MSVLHAYVYYNSSAYCFMQMFNITSTISDFSISILYNNAVMLWMDRHWSEVMCWPDHCLQKPQKHKVSLKYPHAFQWKSFYMLLNHCRPQEFGTVICVCLQTLLYPAMCEWPNVCVRYLTPGMDGKKKSTVCGTGGKKVSEWVNKYSFSVWVSASFSYLALADSPSPPFFLLPAFFSVTAFPLSVIHPVHILYHGPRSSTYCSFRKHANKQQNIWFNSFD